MYRRSTTYCNYITSDFQTLQVIVCFLFNIMEVSNFLVRVCKSVSILLTTLLD